MQEKLNEMRIIGGLYRHRKIYWPSDKNIRPTKDRIREAIFNALGDISNKSFLDLYSGSGAMGIEAISRDAKISYFVDLNKNAINCIKDNISRVNIPKDKYFVIYNNDLVAIKTFIDEEIQFDIVFLDPPYKKGEYENILNLLLQNNIISEDGIIIMESDYQLDIEIPCKKHKIYKYGKIFVNIFWR
ncbi:MAG: 16S rRNA (guanine(966)-N(2))-methyltransferase RsmD [Bacilli bacterium]|nr:16S rRNA (guanine(966)-N(2))-methyltransferase RsmD [Bacilli bacterium]